MAAVEQDCVAKHHTMIRNFSSFFYKTYVTMIHVILLDFREQIYLVIV